MQSLDVTVIFDGTINPPAPKMVACVHPGYGWFYRINSSGHWRPRVSLRQATHTFLKRDSFLECGDPLELDEYVVDEALARHGVIGAIDRTLKGQIIAALGACQTLRAADKRAIVAALP